MFQFTSQTLSSASIPRRLTLRRRTNLCSCSTSFFIFSVFGCLGTLRTEILESGKLRLRIMTRSRRHKDICRNNNEVSQGDCMEGTSARTRPLSFNDIMLRRKTKGDAAKQVADGPGGAHIVLAREHVEKKLHSPEYHRQLNEDFVPTDTKHTSNDPQKVSSWNKGNTDASSKYEKLVQDKDTVFRDPEFKLKSIVNKNVSSDSATGGKSEKHYHRNRKKDCLSTYDSDNVSDKQQVKDSVKKELAPERSREKSKLNKKLLGNEDRQVYRKRKPDKHIISDAENEYKKIEARDVTQTDKFPDRSRDKSKKESKYKHHYEEEDKARGRSAGKKHESETKGVNLTGAFLEESRLKRRRSHSRERDKDKGRRSPSRSPKVHKHTSKNKRQHGELPSHSTKDRSGKEHSDVDKKRISSNGSSSQYKRNTGSSSGLGGYSPRKRKTEAAAKTPSPTRRSPEKKLAGWDLPPAGKESITTGPVLSLNTSDQNLSSNVKEFPSGTPVTPTMVKPIGISHLTLSSQMHAVESIQLTQATRPMRRLYVENLPASASEKDLMECINNCFLSSVVNYIHGTRPCISCIIHREKGQALLEFLTPEDASAALSFNGISFFGFDLKLRRPKDYTEVTTGLPDQSLAVADSISNIVEDSPHKIFIGGLSKFITSDNLLEIAGVFGPVKAYHFKFISDINGPCAFLEYVDHSITSKACAGLNGMRLGGQVVTAVVATPEPFLEEKVRKLPFYGIPENAKPLLEKPTAVLKLQNVLDPEGLLSLSESELEEIMEDIKLECSRFGTVKSVNIVKPTNSNVTTDEFEEKNTDASTDACGLEFVDKICRTEQFGERFNELGEDRLEPQEISNDFVNNNQPVEDNEGCHEPVDPEIVSRSRVIGDSLSDEIIAEKLMEDETCEPRSVDKNISIKDPSSQGNFLGFTAELNNQQNASNIEFKSRDKNADFIPVPNIDKPLTKEETKLEEDDAKIRSAVKLEADEFNSDHGDVFEPGTVFVEYKRAEATCMAAHCLQGRLFDGRVLTVGYVDHVLYQTRFR